MSNHQWLNESLSSYALDIPILKIKTGKQNPTSATAITGDVTCITSQLVAFVLPLQ